MHITMKYHYIFSYILGYPIGHPKGYLKRMFFDRKTYQIAIKNGLKNVTDTPNVRGFSICFFPLYPIGRNRMTVKLLE